MKGYSFQLTDDVKKKIQSVYGTYNGGITQLAAELGVHRSTLNYHACRLGYYPNQIARKPWSAEEIALIENHPEMTHQEILLLLRRHKYVRKIGSIKKLRWKMGWRDKIYRDYDEVGYSLRAISEMIGASASIVRTWFRRGLFEGRQIVGEEDTIRVSRKELRRFLIENVHVWEPAKCDKYWLVDMLNKE